MIIGVLTVDIGIPFNRSLKSKRQVIKSLKDKIKTRFNVAISETDNHDLWQRATFSIATIGTDKKIVNSILSKVNNFIEGQLKLDILDSKIEIL